MFFLTYIKGTRVNEWVMAVNRWLARQIQGGINTADERLWNEVAASFTWQFADSLAKENAQSILRAGVKCYESGHVSFPFSFHYIPSHTITCRPHDSDRLRTDYRSMTYWLTDRSI